MLFRKKAQVIVELLTESHELDFLKRSFYFEFHTRKEMLELQRNAVIHRLKVFVERKSGERE